MKLCKSKLLPILLACALILTIMPVAVFALPEATVVYSEEQLNEAIAAIPKGESGEITVQAFMHVKDTVRIEGKSVVLNLKDAEISAVEKTVIEVVNGNLTINATNSMLRVAGSSDFIGSSNGKGILSITNAPYNSSTTYRLIINGGNYQTAEGDNALVVSPGTETEISKVSVSGAISAAGDNNASAGKVVISSGEFNTDISAFVKANHYCGQSYSYWYVREKEYSDEFKALFPDNKLVVNAAPPTDEESFYIILEDFFI